MQRGAECRARDAEPDAGDEVDADAEPRRHRRLRIGIVRADAADLARQRRALVAPAHPARDGRPGRARRGRADDEPEMPGGQRQLMHVGARRGAAHGARGARRRDLVDLADDRQHGQRHVGKRHEPVVDHEAARQHAVVLDELGDEVRQRRSRPREPAARLDELALALARKQRVAIVQREHELDLLAQRLGRVEQAKAEPAGPGRDGVAGQRAVGDQARAADGELFRDPERQRAPHVDRRAERDHAREALAAPVGGGLVAVHAALRVAAEMHVAPGLGAHDLDGVADRDHVIGQRALQAALLVLGRAEVDDPRVGAALGEHRDGARARRDVVDVGGEHHRRDEQDRR